MRQRRWENKNKFKNRNKFQKICNINPEKLPLKPTAVPNINISIDTIEYISSLGLLVFLEGNQEHTKIMNLSAAYAIGLWQAATKQL